MIFLGKKLTTASDWLRSFHVAKAVKSKSQSPTFRRWYDIIRLAFVAFALAGIFRSTLLEVFLWFCRYAEKVPFPFIYIALLVFTAGVSHVIMHVGGLRTYTLKTIGKYPPAWVAAVLASGAIIGFVLPKGSINWAWGEGLIINQTTVAAIFSEAVGVVIAFSSAWFESIPRNPIKDPVQNITRDSQLRNVSEEDQTFIDWICNENPIGQPRDDLFGHDVIAKRIAEHLLLKIGPSNVGLVGPYGSGKSSLLNLVEYHLQLGNRNLIRKNFRKNELIPSQHLLCRIDGWGYSKGSVAQKILIAAIETVKCHVDCIPISSLPGDYQQAISGLKSPVFQALTVLVQPPHDLSTQLAKLDDTLTAAGLRLVIFLEDLDRIDDEEIIRNELPSLLDRLRGLRNVAFILAIGSERMHSDILIRICDHIEAMPLSSQSVLHIISRFQEVSLKYFQFEDLVPPEERADMLGFVSIQTQKGLRNVWFEGKEEAWDICRLTKTPRLLKIVLRRTYSTWLVLHGEIDFHDLLVVNVLRYAAPQSFDFLLNNIGEIRGLANKMLLRDGNRKERIQSIDAIWSKAVDGVRWDTASAERLVKFILPIWEGDKINQRRLSPQGIQYSLPTDYWTRFLEEEFREDEIKDQTVINSVKKWQESPDGHHFEILALPATLEQNPSFAGKIRQFAPWLFDAAHIRSISSSVFSMALKQHGVNACRFNIESFNLLKELSFSASKTREDEDEYLKWLHDEIINALPVSMRLASDLILTMWPKGPYMADDVEQVKLLGKDVINNFKDIFEPNPAKMLEAIDSQDVSILHTFLRLIHTNTGSEFDLKDWYWFSMLILQAGEIEPKKIIPQIITFCVDDSIPSLRPGYSFKEGNAKAVFGDDLEPLMILLAREIDNTTFQKDTRERISCARSFATDWLARESSGKSEARNQGQA